MAHLIFSPSISHICPNCYPIVFLKLVDSCIIRLAPPSQALVFTLQITRCWTQLFSAHDRYTLSFELTHPPPYLSFCCLLLHNIYSVFCRLPFQTRPLGVLSSPIVSAKSGKGWASLFWWRHNCRVQDWLSRERLGNGLIQFHRLPHDTVNTFRFHGKSRTGLTICFAHVVACSPNLVPRAFSAPPIFWGKSPGDEVAALHLWYSSLFLSVDVDAAYDALVTCLAKGVFDWQYSRIRIMELTLEINCFGLSLHSLFSHRP